VRNTQPRALGRVGSFQPPLVKFNLENNSCEKK